MLNTANSRMLVAGLCLTALILGSCKGKKAGNPREVTASAHQINDAAFWDGSVWFVETAGKVDEEGGSSAASRLVRLRAEANAQIEHAADLDAVEPYLVAGADRLWILSSGSVATYKDGKLSTTKLAEPLEKVSRPFLHKGGPALIASEPPGYRLLIWENDAWKPTEKLRMKLPNESDDCTDEYLRAFEHDGVVHVFCQVPFAAPVYYHRGLPLADAEQHWEKVAEATGQWKPACLGGKPSFFFHTSRDGLVVIGLIRREDKWEEFFSRAIGLDIGLGICPTGKGEDFVLLRRILPLGIKVIGVENGRPTWAYEGEGDTNIVQLLTE